MRSDGRGIMRLPMFFWSKEFMQVVEGGVSHMSETFGWVEAGEGGAEVGASVSGEFGG